MSRFFAMDATASNTITRELLSWEPTIKDCSPIERGPLLQRFSGLISGTRVPHVDVVEVPRFAHESGDARSPSVR